MDSSAQTLHRILNALRQLPDWYAEGLGVSALFGVPIGTTARVENAVALVPRIAEGVLTVPHIPDPRVDLANSTVLTIRYSAD